MRTPDKFWDDSGEIWFHSTYTQTLIKGLEARRADVLESWATGALQDQRLSDGAVGAVQNIDSVLQALVDLAVGQPPEGEDEKEDEGSAD